MKARIGRSHVSHERWLVSYADFITLLFAFFVVLYAFAKADEKQHRQVSAAIESGFRSLSIASSSPPTTMPIASSRSVLQLHSQNEFELSSAATVLSELESMRRNLLNRLSPQIAHKTVAVELSSEGLVISLREAGFFDSGKAMPRPETTETLREISQSIRGTSYDLRVEGHTDNIAIHNAAFDSNWELSSARATSVARMLLQFNAIPPQQLTAAGCAEYHPVATNNTPEGRAENRRVDLVVMPRVVLPLPSTENHLLGDQWRKITEQ